MDHVLSTQTTTPINLSRLPQKQELFEEYHGRSISSLRTPNVVIDRAVFARNCAAMHKNAKTWGARFRAHVKTHKTAEGIRMQLSSSEDKTNAIVVSTLMEAHQVVEAGLVKDRTVLDILYGLPVAINKIADLSNLWDHIAPSGGIVRVLVDHPKQVEYLEAFERQRGAPRKWSVFVKVEAGSRRAGVEPNSPLMTSLLKHILASQHIALFGFYCHAGQSYSSTSEEAAAHFLSVEVDSVNRAAGAALELVKIAGFPALEQPFVLAVGSTPTAHAATAETRAHLASILNGTLELHAGNYPLLDLQQLHTGLIREKRIAQRVLATVISYYPGRGNDGANEALCDAGAIAMSKDTGPSGSFGKVVGKAWELNRVSQEHGILTRTTVDGEGSLEIGEVIEIIGQHACLTLAAYPWYYIVDSDIDEAARIIQDVWVPWKGW